MRQVPDLYAYVRHFVLSNFVSRLPIIGELL